MPGTSLSPEAAALTVRGLGNITGNQQLSTAGITHYAFHITRYAFANRRCELTTPTTEGSAQPALPVVGDGSGIERAVEVQLRTRVMHEWAIAVERLSGRVNEDLKSGRGPAEVLALLKAVSEAMAIEETGAVVPEDHLDAIARLREAAVPYLGRPPR